MKLFAHKSGAPDMGFQTPSGFGFIRSKIYAEEIPKILAKYKLRPKTQPKSWPAKTCYQKL